MNTSIYKKVSKLIEKINDEIDITEESDIIKESLFDSMEFVTFLVDLENEFNVEISADEFIEKDLGLISNLVNYLEEYTK